MTRPCFAFATIIIFFSVLSSVYAQDKLNPDYQNEVLMNWISVVEDGYSIRDTTKNSSSIYDRISESFFDLYKNSGDIVYLKYSLHEADHDKRNEIIRRLTINELDMVSYIAGIYDHDEFPEHFYELASFSAANIYHFYRIPVPEANIEDVIRLLDHWENELPELYEKNTLLASFLIHSLVHGYFEIGNYKKAFEVGKLILVQHPFPPSRYTINLFNYLAFSARSAGHFKVSLYIYQNETIPLTTTINDEPLYLKAKMDYALTQYLIGNIQVAKNEYESIFLDIDHLNDERYRSALFNNLALCYLNTGQFDKYIEFQLNAFDVAKAENNFDDQISILRNLYIYYRRLYETDIAHNYLTQALKIAKEHQLTSNSATILITAGIHSRDDEDNFIKALDYFYEAHTYAINYKQIFNNYYEIAKTYLLLKNFDHSEKYAQKIIDLSRARNDNRGFKISNILLANIYLQSGSTDLASQTLSKFTEIENFEGLFDTRVLAHNISLQIDMENGNYSEAFHQSSAKIAQILDWLRDSSNQDTGHMRMDPEFSEAFRIHLNLLEKLNRPHEALIAIGELRSLTRSGFYNNPLLKSQLLSEEDLIRDYELSNRITQLRSQYSDATGEQKILLGNELLAATSERNVMHNQAFPQDRETPYEHAMHSLRDQLRSDQMVFYFSVFDGQFFRFSITRRNIEMKIFPKDDIYLDIMNNAVSSIGHSQTSLNSLYKVYTTFFEGEIPDRIRHIYVIPDGPLYSLPVEILPITKPASDFDYRSANYLVEKYSVSYSNSLSDITGSRNSSHRDFHYDMAGFGIRNFSDAGHPHLTDLPFGTFEVTKSTEALNQFSRKKLFLDSESTTENFRAMAGNSRIIHIATHSTIDRANPLYSSLYMYNGAHENTPNYNSASGQNGIIRAFELFDMNLNADLIFLSSCGSGTGSYLPGTGILGFSRALSYAGAKSLALNLWPIRDQTAAKLAIRFYEELNNGKNKAEALRAAQIFYLRNYNSDPYLWGSFVLYGNIDPVLTPGRQYQKMLALLLFIILGFFSSIRYFRKAR